jgi:Domain of unknown function (DUF1707)
VENPPGPRPEPPYDPRLDLRVSHDDRERVVEHLRRAAGEGRLDIDELEERLERAFAAKTYRDLRPLLADLPGHGAPVPSPTPPAPPPVPSAQDAPAVRFTTAVGGTPSVYRSQAILGDQRREGAWVMPASYTATAILGSVRLDLRAASFAEQEVTITCTVILGDLKIRVGPDVTVVDDVSTLLADSKQRSSRDLPPVPHGGPVLRLRGTAVMGDIKVERLMPGENRVRRWRRGQIRP